MLQPVETDVDVLAPAFVEAVEDSIVPPAGPVVRSDPELRIHKEADGGSARPVQEIGAGSIDSISAASRH